MVENLLANAGDLGLIPRLGGSHMGLGAATTRAHIPRATAGEAITRRRPCLPQLEKAHRQQRRPRAALNEETNNFSFKKKKS